MFLFNFSLKIQMESAVICVICDTQLIDADDKAINCASALPCGHVFHKVRQGKNRQ